ncbi:hypothetical protein [Parafrankia sp. BMG5.11]|uniref:hypothetical protein n=1 Tax=Parafrankia sp. BMG5.11 TaxID=222540 RepID=UPI00103B3AE7|nr:hypothetical protein [Parafrankia sp. BMG5.11]TCJ31541.1 hypothetical protein E0504_47910 [Parafrankia sp. BMG5.11]
MGRLDLLRSVLRGRERWTAAVAHEASRSARYFPDLALLPAEGWLGEAIEIVDEADIRRVNRIRRAVFGGTDAEPLRHLGEAESCFVILEWAAFVGSWWISDDRESLRYARRRGITTAETIDVMGMAVADGHVDKRDAVALMHRMTAEGRHLRLPRSDADLVT